MKSTSLQVFCLIRAKDKEDGLNRILNKISEIGVTMETSQIERILPVIGDLSSAQLGLSDEDFQEISRTLF